MTKMNHIGCVQDDLLAFLSELDNDWVLESTPQTLSACSGHLRPKKPRRNRRVDLMNARQEIVELQNQLKIMYNKLDPRATRTTTQLSQWKKRTLTEKVFKLRADEENSRLRKRIKETMKLTRRINLLTHQQAEFASKSLQISRPITDVELDNNAQVFRALHMCIDSRSRSSLTKIVQQCYAQSVLTVGDLERVEWHEHSIGDRIVVVDFREAVAVPFSSAYVFSAMRRYAAVNSIEDKRDVKVNARVSSSHEMKTDSRLIVRRFTNVRMEHMLLWEDAALWQNNPMSVGAFVRSSGWSFVCPVVDHPDELSLVWMGGQIQIVSADGSTLKPSNAHVRSIISNMHLQQRARVACMEAALLAAKAS